MLVCQCNVITDRAIRRIITDFLDEDPWQIIVPAKVYKALGARTKCAGCVPNVVDLIIEVTEEYHLHMVDRPADAREPVPARLRAMRRKRQGGSNERRSTGHRAA